MFPFSLPLLIKEKTELVDFEVLGTSLALANKVFCGIYFWLCRKIFLSELHKKVNSRVSAPERVVLTEGFSLNLSAMFMTLAVGEVDCPASSLLQSSMLFHALHVLPQVNQSWRVTLFTSTYREKAFLTTPYSHFHSLNFHKLMLLTSLVLLKPVQIIPAADLVGTFLD